MARQYADATMTELWNHIVRSESTMASCLSARVVGLLSVVLDFENNAVVLQELMDYPSCLIGISLYGPTDLVDGGNARSLTSLPGLSPAPQRFFAGYDPPQRSQGPHGFLMATLCGLMGAPPVKVG